VPSRDHRLSGERSAIRRLEQSLARGASGAGRVVIGIGDDAAVLRSSGAPLVYSVDACVEGVHFDRRWLGLQDVGWRSFQAAASDLAAMGARPVAALSSLILPARIGLKELAALGRGQAAASRDTGCPIVGGNLARGSELSVTTTVLGECEHPLTRSGAVPGDELWLIGEVGLAAAGLEVLRSGVLGKRTRPEPALRRCIAAWRRPRARIALGQKLAGRASAAIDISDGLSGDAGELARASGVRVVLEARRLLAALPRDLLRACSRLELDVLATALRGGEDYALLASGPSKRRPPFAAHIGRVERGNGARYEPERGRSVVLRPGFDHFPE
jgi:thiamine-monophosphate kinase